MEAENSLRKRMQALKPVKTNVEEEKMADSGGDGREEEEPLSPWARGFREAGSDLYVIGIMGTKTKVETNFIKENLVPAVLKNPRFSSLQVIDEKTKKLKWVKTNINVDEHIIVPELIKPNIESPQTFLEDYISNLSKTPMGNSKPLWELHILNLKIHDSENVGVFRVHHSLGDGLSLLSLVLASTRKVSNPEALPAIPMKKESKKSNLRGFWSYLIKFWNTMVDVIMLIATMLFLKDTKTPLTRSSCDGPSTRRFVFKIFSLDDIKLVKNATNTTVNDVILAVIQACLSRHLNRLYGDENRATEKENNLPKKLRFRAIVPVTLRPGINVPADRMEEKAKEMKGNNFGYVLLPLTIAIKDDPLDYIRTAKAAMDRKKNSLEAIATSTIIKFLLNFFDIKGASLLTHKIPSQTTMVFSNVPGPIDEIAYYGHPISFMAPTSYGLPNGLSIHVLSYFNKVAIVLSVDETTIPNPHILCTDLEESLKLIKDAAIANAAN